MFLSCAQLSISVSLFFRLFLAGFEQYHDHEIHDSELFLSYNCKHIYSIMWLGKVF